jgi:lysosomal alpha-mannosidase
MHTFGEDFNFANAIMMYKNVDKLIDYINNNFDKYGVKIMYSTPSIYLEALNK